MGGGGISRVVVKGIIDWLDPMEWEDERRSNERFSLTLSPCDLIVIYGAGSTSARADTDPLPPLSLSLVRAPCAKGPCGLTVRALHGGGLEPTGTTEPTRRFRTTFSHSDHIQFVRFIIAWAQYKPIRTSVC